jgi:N-formylmaleamate deformylase
MLEYTENDININGWKTHYYRTGGDKSPFILLHGATDNGLCWTRVAEMLSARYDVIMPDALGHGLSDRLDPAFTFQQHAEQVAGLVRELNISQPIIMGHSMGAGTAVNLAIEYPDIPRAIILEDPPWGVLPPEPENRQSPAADFRASLVRLNKLPLEQIIEERKKQNLSWSDEEILIWAKAKQQFDPSLFSRPIIDQRSYEELVPKIKCPTLLIHADAGIVSEATAKRAAEVWESDEPFHAIQIKDAGHNIRREQYAAFTRALTDFLSEIS